MVLYECYKGKLTILFQLNLVSADVVLTFYKIYHCMTLTVKQLKKSSFIAMFISISNIPWNSEFYKPVQLIPSSRMCCWHRKTKLECDELSFAAQNRLFTLINSNNIMVTPYRIYLLIIVIWYMYSISS